MKKRRVRKNIKKLVKWYETITCSGAKYFAVEVMGSDFISDVRTTIKALKTHFEESRKHQETFHKNNNLPRCKPRFFALVRH